MTYSEGSLMSFERYPENLSPHHRTQLEKARSYLESIASKHPEWIVKKARY